MKLLLDEHYSPMTAARLRERDYDVIATAERDELRELSDEDLLLWAQREGRVVVTENARHFMPLHHAWLSRGEVHAGILLTSPRAFPRRTAAMGHLIESLATFMDARRDDEALAGEIAWL